MLQTDLTMYRKAFLSMNENRRKKWGLHVCAFVSIMALTFWSVFRNQDLMEMMVSIRRLSMQSVVMAVLLAVLFVAGEGCMIWYLLKGIGERTGLLRCISYSFIGFFFSGITPSATGGQPVQLYYMKKDGNKISSASVVLMAVAVIFKFVPVLVLVMFSPGIIRRIFYKTEKILIFFKVWKKSDLRKDRMDQFLSEYQETVGFLRSHKKMIIVTVIGTFLQRGSAFLLTCVVYRGLGLYGTSLSDIILLQASVCIAVDMLPVPGAQGITEAMYRVVFETVFPADCLMASVCITRGISFYLVMAVSFTVWGIVHLKKKSVFQ